MSLDMVHDLRLDLRDQIEEVALAQAATTDPVELHRLDGLAHDLWDALGNSQQLP